MATLRAAEPARALAPAPFRVERRRRETADTWTLELGPLAGPLPAAPGQFTMVYVFGCGEVPISVSGDPADASRVVHTVRAVGPVTRAICSARLGDVLGLRGPFGTVWPLDRALGRDVVVVAGGLGLAPLRPAVLQLLARRADYGRVVLLYGARTPADLLFARELGRWGGRLDVDVAVTVDAAGPDWRGNVGLVTRLVERAHFDDSAVALVCGPELMMRYAAAALCDHGLPEAEVFVSLERNMHCGVGLCGHCQLGPLLVCRDGPVFPYDRVGALLGVAEL